MNHARLTPTEEDFVLRNATVPEHVLPLMEGVSGGTPFLIGGYLAFELERGVILVGYPLGGEFDLGACDDAAREMWEKHPENLWYVGPALPPSVQERCVERRDDRCYRLDLPGFRLRSNLRRTVRRAEEALTVDRSRRFTAEHEAVTAEYRQRLEGEQSPLVAALFESMPRYLSASATSLILDARTRDGRLSAFCVVEQAAPAFDVYVLGGYSRENYVPYASDLLFHEMITVAMENEKESLNLGLGVNPGIRRFKEKWGGRTYTDYAYARCALAHSRAQTFLDYLLGGRL